MHWGALHAPRGAGSVNMLTHGERDPTSRQPELKAATVRVEPLPLDARRATAAARARRLVVVGTGMAGLEVVHELLERAPGGAWRITMLGEEPTPAYNRVLLSKLLAGGCSRADLELRPHAWYQEHEIDLRTGAAAAAVDLDARRVRDEHGASHDYDALVLATGSRAFVPPIDGRELAHVHGFRTLRDAERIAAGASHGAPAVVVGGGLLGIEAAAGLRARGMTTTVVELAERLMPQQLDAGAAAVLGRELQAQGTRALLGRSVREITGEEVVLDDGERHPASLVVIAAGVRAETALARAAGLEVGRGVLVDDEMRTSAPAVWAVGECAEHRGVVQGLWAPVAEQARTAGASIAGDPAGFHGARPATSLKVAGIELFAGGSATAARDQHELVRSDTRSGVYRKLVLDGERLAGAVLVGDTSERATIVELLRSEQPVPATLLAAPGPTREAAAEDGCDPTVCACNAVTRGTILAAIESRQLRTVAEVARATRASTGCGSCAPDIDALLAARSSDRNIGGTDMKPATPMIAA
jgi:ferredoxin-nitrate reductase